MHRKKPGTESVLCTEPELGDRFPDYLDGQLTLDEAQHIEKHLLSCPECRRELDLWLSLSEEGLPSFKPDQPDSRIK